MVGEAFSQDHPGEYIVPIYGFNIAGSWPTITREAHFLIYLHGHISDPTTWVITRNQLAGLKRTKAHEMLLSHLYLNHTVIFFGLSVDDIAVSEPLMTLKSAGFEAPRLFWLTTRNDTQARRWAAENDVQIILYTAENDEEHAAVINRIVDDINSFRSVDSPHQQINESSMRTFSDLTVGDVEPRELAAHDPEVVRKTLSTLLATELSRTNCDNQYSIFDLFVRKYNYAINTKAFYRYDTDKDNIFLTTSWTPALTSPGFRFRDSIVRPMIGRRDDGAAVAIRAFGAS